MVGDTDAGDARREEELRAVTIGDLNVLSGPVSLVDYNAAWPARFEDEARRIGGALGGRALRVEHVGSTSVRGLAAKPVLDVLLVVADSGAEDAYMPSLESAGYALRIREPGWYQHRLFRRPGAPTDVNVHVFSSGCDEIDRMVGFRDRLRTNVADRDLYLRTKRELAGRPWKFVQDYADAKSVVVEEILRRSSSRSELNLPVD